MHRTASCDYDVLVSGELEIELEGGGRRKLKQGDVVVQRGTNHAWHNTTDKPAYLFAVLISAELPLVNGKPMEIYDFDKSKQ